MIDFPWRGSDADESGSDSDAEGDESGSDADDAGAADHADAVVVCEFQDGTLAVYEDRAVVDRVARSKFDDKTIPIEEITGVDYAGGITVGYLQIEQTGVEATTGGLLSDPIDENTLHFQRSGRECAREARDAIRERARG